MYKSQQDPYVYKNTNVLINKLGIRDAGKLELFEAEATAFRFTEPMPEGELNVEHYASVHFHIFQVVYEWAGIFRTIRIAKGTSVFCYPEYINSEMAKLFDQFGASNRLSGLDKNQFSEQAAAFFASLNAIHPFRDGNGRAQLAFLAIIAHKANLAINFENLKPQPFLDAVIKSFAGDNKPLAAEFLGFF